MRLSKTGLYLPMIFVMISGCSQKEEVSGKPFKFTLETGFADAIVHIPIERIGNGEVLYDLDCDGDGAFEQKSLTGAADCTFETAGVHQIVMRGQIPSIKLGDISMYCADDSCMQACAKSCAADCEIANSRIWETHEYYLGAPAFESIFGSMFYVCHTDSWLMDKDDYCTNSCKKNIEGTIKPLIGDAPSEELRWRSGLHILSVDQWGDIEWRSMEEFAYSCENIHTPEK